MKKVLKVFLISFIVLCVIIFSLSLYVGNYVYDYTLNPNSQKNIIEKIPVNEKSIQKSKQWLQQNSKDVYIECEELKLHGYFIPQDSSVYMIMVHGYRSDGSSLVSPAKKMLKDNYNILIPDLRGHGESEGDYIGMGWDDRQDILKWIDFILKQDKQAQIILYGVSMGAATVMNVSGETLPKQVKAIIEDCGYTSVWDLCQTRFDMNDFQNKWALRIASLTTFLRAGYFLKDVEPIEQVKKSQTPILFIHGEDDTFVPSSMLDKLYNAATCPKEKLLIKDAGHADSYTTNPELYYQTVNQFIKKYIK